MASRRVSSVAVAVAQALSDGSVEDMGRCLDGAAVIAVMACDIHEIFLGLNSK